MKIARHAAGALLAASLAALGAGAALVNAEAGPPRAVFLRLPEGTPEPKVVLFAREGADGAWLLEIGVEGFQFSGLCVAKAEAAPVGHAHVLKGDAKIASAFAPVVGLGRLPAGAHTFRVVLRGQDHRALVGRNGLIEAELTISAPGDVT